ncbi:cytochrome c biogenesis protein ResB [Paenibacillus crassostreae]|uniref:Cytochrome C biogenesis protein ResB n=1 Tax=Paenibacillus crassostreae TaxID=1763538 RepID=A0A162RSF2_9BACL|nr:cytochrome c biogenesis protein ResB [Paenibacillus crassostreae]AOZ91403.1 cytochrome C biogenesis protein ResB [Paenibacillus crassostreae]OAB74437.1 cytochrome C biogenesis protein ResB [Paenibacillus crassostreae]
MIHDLLAFQNTKCECGHQNPTGTVLCEACGKPLSEKDQESKELLEMRYDGMARRSQRSSPNFIDRIWNFFSSVKIAVYMIILTLLGSMLGTIFPQESTFLNIDPATYYPETYGKAGTIYYKLGLSHTYESWWFILLLVMIGASLVICSLDRVLPLYKALSKRKVRKHMQFLTRQKVVYQTRIDSVGEDWINDVKSPLKKKGYRVHTDGSALLAEKQRFSRWGPYIIHIGLIIFLLAVLARGLPGFNMDQHLAFPEGEIIPIPNTSMYLENEKFTVEYYTEEDLPEEFKGKNKILPKLFETQAVLYECTENCNDPLKEPKLIEVDRHPIQVNDPLNYKGLMAFQFDFDTTPILRSVTPSLVDTQSGKIIGQFKLDIRDPERNYQVGEYSLKLAEKYMDFGLNDLGEPVSISPTANAPAFLFVITGANLPEEGINYFYFPKQVDKQRFQQNIINEQLAGDYNFLELDVQGMSNVDFSMSTSYLNIRIDKAMPFVWIGAAIVMLGLIMGFYWQHRRIWIRIDDGTLTLAAHTNKNWFGIRREITDMLRKMNMEVDEKSLDNGGNQP